MLGRPPGTKTSRISTTREDDTHGDDGKGTGSPFNPGNPPRARGTAGAVLRESAMSALAPEFRSGLVREPPTTVVHFSLALSLPKPDRPLPWAGGLRSRCPSRGVVRCAT